MKLSEIKTFEIYHSDPGEDEYYARQDAMADAAMDNVPGALHLTYDGIQPDDSYYDDMEVNVEFDGEEDDYFDHEFGREDIKGAVWYEAITLRKPCKQYDAETDKVIKEWPKGTDITKMPGWSESDDKYFQEQVEEHLS